MTIPAHIPYEPLDTLKSIAEDIWIVDGPEVGMRSMGITLPFPTRMTVVRLPSGNLWVHSPVAWSDELARDLMALGPVLHLVAPNTLHYSYLADWQARFPEARSYGAPGLSAKARQPICIDEVLGEKAPPSWEGAFDQCRVLGRILSEVDFFHHPSRTLILTDLIENFEPSRLRPRWLRWIIRLAGPTDPDGKAPFDMQWSFIGRKREVRTAVERMIAWAPERIVIAHGRWYDRNGVDELRRAFRWVL